MKIYIVIYDFAVPCDEDVSLKAFCNKEDAIACLKAQVKSIRGDWESHEIEEDTDTRFNAYTYGEYSMNHDTIWIEEHELN